MFYNSYDTFTWICTFVIKCSRHTNQEIFGTSSRISILLESIPTSVLALKIDLRYMITSMTWWHRRVIKRKKGEWATAALNKLAIKRFLIFSFIQRNLMALKLGFILKTYVVSFYDAWYNKIMTSLFFEVNYFSLWETIFSNNTSNWTKRLIYKVKHSPVLSYLLLYLFNQIHPIQQLLQT